MRDLPGIIDADITASAKRNAVNIASALVALSQAQGLRHETARKLLGVLSTAVEQAIEDDARDAAEQVLKDTYGNHFVAKVPVSAVGKHTYTPIAYAS